MGRLSESTTNNVFYKRDKDLCGLPISIFIYCSVAVVHKTMTYVNTKAVVQTQCKRYFVDTRVKLINKLASNFKLSKDNSGKWGCAVVRLSDFACVKQLRGNTTISN